MAFFHFWFLPAAFGNTLYASFAGSSLSEQEILMTNHVSRRMLFLALPVTFAIAVSLFSQVSPEKEAREVFQRLISVAGVSFHENKVREEIQALLPKAAKPIVDEMGNLVVILGAGKPEILFIAHMDEIGLEVSEINPDGTLKTRGRGGYYSTIWESKVVKVHTKAGVVDGVIGPRKSYQEPTPAEHSAGDLVVYVGTNSKADTQALGIDVGDFIVQTKRIIPMGKNKTAAGSTDDRGGCTAQILAVRRLIGKPLAKTIAFAWVVQEETGLSGSRGLTKSYSPKYVMAVDTFVSSDAPFDPRNVGYTPLGKGAVLRTFDSSNIAPEDAIARIRKIAEERKIPIQWGITSGGNDGSVFLAEGSVDIPLSWPGIYSHSYVSVMDFRDMVALADLIAAISEVF
jgi:putative aminopeptidase